MRRRSGVTLIEVLVSIFVTAIGLLALLALFPVGAFSMAQALKNGRCVQASQNAMAVYDAQNLGQDSVVTGLVYVDPIGTSTSSSVGSISFSVPLPPLSYTSPGISRVSPSFVTGAPSPPGPLQAALRWLTLPDDITFSLDGTPSEPDKALPLFLGTVQREDRYSWTYMLQPLTTGPIRLVDRTVVVYSGRSSAVVSENTFNFIKSDVSAKNSLTIGWDPTKGQSKPEIKNGSWILDATVVVPYVISGPPPTIGTASEPHGYFYRVVGVTQVPGANQLLLEVQPNIRASSFTFLNGTEYDYGVVVVMDNLAEVFAKGPG